jgi:hypothetical protein
MFSVDRWTGSDGVDHSVGRMLTHVDAFYIGRDCGSRRLFGGCPGLTVLQKRPNWLFLFCGGLVRE